MTAMDSTDLESMSTSSEDDDIQEDIPIHDHMRYLVSQRGSAQMSDLTPHSNCSVSQRSSISRSESAARPINIISEARDSPQKDNIGLDHSRNPSVNASRKRSFIRKLSQEHIFLR